MFKTRFISMLVLLAAVATGARAQWTGGTYTATATENLGAITVNGDATLTINSDVTVTVTGGINVASGTLTVTGPGTLVVTGAKGTDGGGGFTGGNGTPGGVAISGNIIVQDGATVQANGGAGGNGGAGEPENGGHGANGGAAISGNVTVQGGATVTATGGNGGNGGNSGGETGGNGGNGGNAFAGTLTYKSGTVTANGGSGGSGGTGMGGMANGSSGSAGKAFANDVDFSQTNGYSVTNGTSPIGSVLNQTKVVISGGTPIPTGYSVSLKSSTEDDTNWQGKAGEGDYQELPLEGLEAGTTVSVKYSGTKKVKSVKAKKKAAAAPALNLTSPAVGQVIGDDGKNYDYASLPGGVTAVAKICYVSGSNGLALALADEGQMNWSTAISTCAAHTPAFTGGTWKLATQDEWNNMISGAGSYTALRNGFTSVGGSNLESDLYWSSSERNASLARYYSFFNGSWSITNKDGGNFVRSCLAF